MISQFQSFNRLTISKHDFDRCLEFLLLLNWSNYGTATYEALLLTSIIFYARAFSYNERDKNANATPKIDDQIIDQLSSKEKQLHEIILTLRNKAVAHAEWTNYPTGISENSVITSIPFSIWEYFKSSSDIQEFISLVKKVLHRAHELSGNKLREFSFN